MRRQVTLGGIELMFDEYVSDLSEPVAVFVVLDAVNNALRDLGMDSSPQITITDPDAPLDIQISADVEEESP